MHRRHLLAPPPESKGEERLAQEYNDRPRIELATHCLQDKLPEPFNVDEVIKIPSSTLKSCTFSEPFQNHPCPWTWTCL